MDVTEEAQEFQAVYNARNLRDQQQAAALDAPGADVCADCGEPIPAERREALPSAVRCVDCQEYNERTGRVFRVRV